LQLISMSACQHAPCGALVSTSPGFAIRLLSISACWFVQALADMLTSEGQRPERAEMLISFTHGEGIIAGSA
jgi:hypothetical protein